MTHSRARSRADSIVPLLPKPNDSATAWQQSHSDSHYAGNAPFLLKYRSSQWFILITVCIALFTDSFVYGVLVPVLPFLLSDRSHISPGMAQLWTSALFAGFGGAILIGSPICGWYADRSTSRQFPLLLGLPVMAIATAALGAGESVWILLASRILQGFSASIVWTVGLALTVDTVGKGELATWMGTALSSSSIGLVISPLLGGIVYSKTGLWGVLGMMIGLIGLNIILITLLIEKRTAKQYIIIDTSTSTPHERRASTASYQTFGRHDIHIHHERPSQSRPCSDSASKPFVGSADPAAPLATTKSHVPPMLTLLRSPRILAGAYGVFTQFGLLASFDAFLPLFVSRRFHWGSLGAGLIFLCIAFPALTGPVAGKLADKYGNRKVALAGCLLATPPLIGLRWVGYAGPEDKGGVGGQVVLLGGLLVLIGLFLTLIISPLAADRTSPCT
jgi:MFS family permease